jgi:hypothetical protein
MINKLHLPDVCFIPEKKWPEKLAAARPAWILEIEAEEPVTLEQCRSAKKLHEVYLRTRGGKVAAKHSRVSLPTGCSRNWCVDGPKVYLLDDQVKTCPFKRIRPVNLRTEENNLLISDELSMLFNVTKGALITRITLNWALLKNRKIARTETVQMDRLLTNVENQYLSKYH